MWKDIDPTIHLGSNYLRQCHFQMIFLTIALFDECHRSQSIPQETLSGFFCLVASNVSFDQHCKTQPLLISGLVENLKKWLQRDWLTSFCWFPAKLIQAVIIHRPQNALLSLSSVIMVGKEIKAYWNQSFLVIFRYSTCFTAIFTHIHQSENEKKNSKRLLSITDYASFIFK